MNQGVTYLDLDQVKMNNYSLDVLELIKEQIENNPNIKFKVCKVCSIPYPLSNRFFLSEKRLNDGLENKCRVCRKGKFLTEDNENIGAKTTMSKSELKGKNIIELYELYLQIDKLPYGKFMTDHYKEIVKYLLEEKNNMSDEQILSIDRKWIQSHKLYGISINKFDGSIHKMINDVYPNRFKYWEFKSTYRDYWKDKNNIIEALTWFIDRLIKDNVINNIDDIPNKVSSDTFHDYKLGGLLKHVDNSFYGAIDLLYPNRFCAWEYNFAPNGYWQNKENRIKAFKQLIENRLMISKDDLTKVLSYEYINLSDKYNKFSHVINDYYNLNIWDYVRECYPNIKLINVPYQNSYLTLDGIIVRSEPERIIHHIFKESMLDCRYDGSVFYNAKYDEKYIPDWIINHKDKIIIVEYYGMLDMKNVDFGYDDKYKRKHEYYKKLCKNDNRYIYMDLYNEDIKRDRSGLVNKFKSIGIELILGCL